MEKGVVVQNASFWDFKGAEENIDQWMFMHTPYAALFILTSYLFFVLHCGPKFMENRPAYKLNNVLLVYNAFQVIYSAYVTYLGIDLISNNGLMETGCLLDDKHIKYYVTSGHWCYFMAKMTEFLDTIFFVLRKKWNQVTFLHVYHHTIMYVATWVTLKYEPTYTMVFLGTINSFVHIIMYGYYGLSAFPGLQKYLWWKKYITKMQLIQFMLVMIQVTVNHKITSCPPSYFLLTVTWVHGILFMYLFADFYVKSYIQKRKEDREKSSPIIKEKEKNGVQTKYSDSLKNSQQITDKNR